MYNRAGTGNANISLAQRLHPLNSFQPSYSRRFLLRGGEGQLFQGFPEGQQAGYVVGNCWVGVCPLQQAFLAHTQKLSILEVVHPGVTGRD